LSESLDRRIREQIAHAYQHAPAIRRLMDNAGVTPQGIQSAADLPRIPVTSKDQLVQMHQDAPPFGGFLAVDPATLPRIYVSPGPIYDPQPPDVEAQRGIFAAFEICGFGAGDRVVNTFAYHLTPAGLLLDEALRVAGCTVIPTGPGNTELLIKLILDLQVTGFVGAPSFLGIVLNKMAEWGFPNEAVPISKALFSTEPYTPSQRARFEGEHHMQTVSVYGTADLGFVGYTTPEVEGFCVADFVYVEIVDPDTGDPVGPGELGEIVATTFNRAYPLVRFGTGDLGALSSDPHPYTGGQHLLGLYGRSGGAIKVRGMFLHPNQIENAVARVPEVKYAQAVITRPKDRDVVTLRVELRPEHAGADVSQPLRAYLEQEARLRIDEVQVVEKGVIDPAQRAVRDERSWQ
jgi:phenylacetate-CoA ligase